MFKKSFVSLYFLPGELQIIQLDAGKKKIKKYATIGLPEGLIENYKVTDKKALTKILKSAWKKIQLKEKSIFIVIPEFSTFVKLFELADIEISELHEAVGWQVHEFLPETLKETMMDWKIISRGKKVYQILAVAVNKDILSRYIEAVEDAGLFPLVVEIPSLSLTRIAANDKEASLVIYLSSKNAVMVILDKDKVLGSSVVQDRDVQDLESTAKRMASHFKNIKITKLMVGGVNIDKSLIEKLSKSFGLRAELLSKSIKGLKEEEIQKYLIPISSQLQEPAEPADPFSLNLLPANLVDKYKRKKLKLQVWGLTLTITLFVSILFLLTLGIYIFMTQQISDFKSQNTAAFQLASKREEAMKQVRDINLMVDKVYSIRQADMLPQEVLNDIARSSTGGIAVSDYKIDLDKGIVVLLGTATDRQSLLTFKQNLEGNPKVSQLEIPISSFTEEFNLDFEASFIYSKEPIKKKGGGK
jgi:DNA-binding ferritin-like protein (Dps family)